MLMCFPALAIAQQTASPGAVNPADAAKLVEFLKGQGTFETWFMQVFKNLDTQIESRARQFSIIGRTIGATGALIQLSVIGWQMQEGLRSWEVTPMIKPIVIAMLLSNWVPFTHLIKKPLQSLSETPEAIFQKIEKDADEYRVKKYERQMMLLDKVFELNAQVQLEQRKVERTEALANNKLGKLGEIVQDIKEDTQDVMDNIERPLLELANRLSFEFQRTIAYAIENLALIILRVCTYCIFFIHKIWLYVLLVLGPIPVGLSLIPGFDSNFSNWVAKYININLYPFICYTIINIGQQLIIAGYKMELDRYNKLIDESGTVTDPGLVLTFVSQSGFLHMLVFSTVPYIVTAIGIRMTPTIADAIISGGGSQIMSKAKQTAQSGYSAAKSVASAGSNIVTKGAAAAAKTGKEIAASARTMTTTKR